MGLRDRILTPGGARAITSPSAILLAGAGVAVGFVATGLWPIAAAAGAAGWLARVATSLPRAPTVEAVSTTGLSDPWRRFVTEALVVASAPGGVVRERLTEIAGRVDDGVRESSRIAQRGQQLETALGALDDPRELRRQRQALRPAPGSSDERVAASLDAQIASTERISSLAGDTAERLRVLDARLDETVARAVELSLQADDVGALEGLGASVEGLVADMEALRQALDESHAIGRIAR
jgi:hypothetical protein